MKVQTDRPIKIKKNSLFYTGTADCVYLAGQTKLKSIYEPTNNNVLSFCI